MGMLIIVFLVVLASCKQGGGAAPEEDPPQETVQTPVTVTAVMLEPLVEYIELNATSSFMQKNYIKANATGYLRSNFTQPGQYVNVGQVLFTITTKEAQSIGNAVNKLDSGFRFSGVNTIKAAGRGFITQLNHQAGDYVQDGEQLAVISDLNSFAFLLDLPYELRPYIQGNKTVDVLLPDSEKLTGTISRTLPSVDPASQTQSLVIKVNASHSIPENLVAKVRIVKLFKPHAVSLPKAALLADETQTSFWIMKMIDSITAVKVPVTKGIETNDRVEIIAPALTAADRILLSGNYGLADTAKVKIIK
jgi:multidrug efflux pump subunit AcrA (membrane-fusion protein)